MAQSYNSSINQEFSVAELALKLNINHHCQKFLEKSITLITEQTEAKINQ